MEEESGWKIRKDYDSTRDLLGRGGYGAVFRGKLVNLNNEIIEKIIAIKQIDKAKIFNQTSAAEQAAISVNIEMIQKKLNHPNVVKLLLADDEENDFL